MVYPYKGKYYILDLETLWQNKKQEISLKKINGNQYEKTLRNGTYTYYLIFDLTY